MDFSKLTAYLDSLESRYEVHGLDCKIMRGHEVLYRHMAGHSDYARTRPVSKNDLYDLYSCTKVITMGAVMQLVETGKYAQYIFKWDDYPLWGSNAAISCSLLSTICFHS